MINRSRIDPPRRLTFAPSPPHRLPRLIRRLLLAIRFLLLLHDILLSTLTPRQQIPPAPILIRQQIHPGRLIHVQALAPHGVVARHITAAARATVCTGPVVVRDELVNGVCRGEGERGETERLTEEET